ncbi:MAG: biotin--[acetyl-CoA-carboxylase] ligase [Acutalibacteraceae bacterium]
MERYNLFQRIIYEDTISSTNSKAKKLLKNINDNFIIIANKQTNGRGKDLKNFYSPESVGIYMTLVLRNFKNTMPFISKVTALAVLKNIKKFTQNVYIKEPNDILIGNKKVCGILIESSFTGNENLFNYVVVGIGINVNNSDFPFEIQNIATSIKCEVGKEIDRNDLIENIILEFSLLFENSENWIDKEYRENLLKN